MIGLLVRLRLGRFAPRCAAPGPWRLPDCGPCVRPRRHERWDKSGDGDWHADGTGYIWTLTRRGAVPAVTDHLWLGDDPMRSCRPCMDGHHDHCADLIVTPPYGIHACGCTNPTHEEPR